MNQTENKKKIHILVPIKNMKGNWDRHIARTRENPWTNYRPIIINVDKALEEKALDER